MRRLLEKVVTYSLLLFVMGSFTILLLGSDIREQGVLGVNSQSHLGLSAIELLIYFGAASFALLYYRRMLTSLRAAWPFICIALFASMTTIWSVDPQTTLRRSAVLFGTTVFGAYLGGRYSIVEFQRVLLQSLLLMVGASLVVLAVSPTSVLDPSHAHAFRGLTEHKNILGEYMAVLLLLALTCRFRSGWGWQRITIIFIAIFMHLWAHSGTSILAVAATIAMLPILLLLRFKKRQAAPLTFIGAVLLASVFLFSSSRFDSVLDVLGKDRTLTGRTTIWRLVWQAIQQRPLLGYGYDAYWQGAKGSSFHIVATVGWDVPHSHNGYLEALLGFGSLGVGIIAVAVLRTAKDALIYVRSQRDAAGLWPFSFLFFFLVHAIAEAGFIKRDGLSYLLMVVLSTSLALRRQREGRLRENTFSYRSADTIQIHEMSPALLAGTTE